MKLGIVGLPNVGKSTLFNSLTKAGALAANYPFATIDPNVGIVPVPDERLDVLFPGIPVLPLRCRCRTYPGSGSRGLRTDPGPS